MRLQHVTGVIPLDGAERARAFYGGLLGLREKPVLPKLDPARFIWYGAGGDCELHLQLTDEARLRAGAGPDVVRLSIGLEAVDDILADLDQALEAA